MPKKVSRKSKAKKAASPKTAGKAGKKKVIKKKAALKKRMTKKKAAKKKTSHKKAKKKTVTKSKSLRKQAVTAQSPVVEPGPPPRVIPPVEEPASNEEAVGTITHYYSHLSVAVAQINKGTLKIGDSIHIKGHTTDFTQTVDSMEFEHQHVEQAAAGQSVGIKIKDHAREHDIVYLVK